MPVISDMLALHVAAIVDENDLNKVRSINSGTRSYQRSTGGRASLRFAPIDSIAANVMYQRPERKLRAFDPVESFARRTGSASATARTAEQDQEIITAQVDRSFAGQKLSYVGSRVDALI